MGINLIALQSYNLNTLIFSKKKFEFRKKINHVSHHVVHVFNILEKKFFVALKIKFYYYWIQFCLRRKKFFIDSITSSAIVFALVWKFQYASIIVSHHAIWLCFNKNFSTTLPKIE